MAYAKWLGRYSPWLWLALTLLLVAAAAALPRLHIDVNPGKFFLQRDESARANREFKQKYQIGDNIGIYVELGEAAAPHEDLLQPQVMDRLSLLSREIEQLPYVRSVRSLSGLWLKSHGDTAAERLQYVRDFAAKFPELDSLHSQDWRSLWLLVEVYPYDSYFAQLRQKAAAEPTAPLVDVGKLESFRDYLVQRSFNHQVSQVADWSWQLPSLFQQAKLRTVSELLERAGEQEPGSIVGELLDALLRRYQGKFADPELKFIPVGIPVNSHRLERELSADLIKVLGIASLVCLICIFILMQSRMAAVAALLCVVANVLLVFGLSAWLDMAIDKTFVMIPVLLGFASSISYCVHIEKSWEKQGFCHRGGGHSQSVRARQVLSQALAQNFRPLSFAALTTVLSLLSFLVVPIPMIRTAGLQSALAVSFSYVFSLTLFSSLLLNAGKRTRRPDTRRAVRLQRRIQKAVYAPVICLALLCYRRRRVTLVLAALLMAFSLWLLPQLQVDLSTESVLGAKFEYVRELMQVSRSETGAGGFYNVDLIFAEEALQPQYLRQVAKFEQRLASNELVKNVTSVTNFIQSVQRTYRGSSEFPPTARQAQQALLTWEHLFQGESDQWYSAGDHSLRILVQVRQGSSEENIAHMQEVRRQAAEFFPAAWGVRVEPLGGVFQLAIMNQYITYGLLHSFAISLLLVSLLLFVLLRSLRIGLIALVPNLFPVLLSGAAVVLLGRQLEFVSMTVGPMIIGLAVDDTVYFLGYVQWLLRCQDSTGSRGLYSYAQIDRVIKVALNQIAPALITTTLILCVLFASLLLSRAANISYMGLYTIIAMLAALFADLYLTPILLRWAFSSRFRRGVDLRKAYRYLT